MLKRNSTEAKFLKHTDLRLLNYKLYNYKKEKYETKYLQTSLILQSWHNYKLIGKF